MIRKIFLILIGITIGIFFRSSILELLNKGYEFLMKEYNQLKKGGTSVVQISALQSPDMFSVSALNTGSSFRQSLSNGGLLTGKQLSSPKGSDGNTSQKTFANEPIVPSKTNLSRRHIVKQGETLTSIANRYSLNPKDIARWNSFPFNSTLQINDTLRIFDDPSVPLPKKVLKHQVKKGETFGQIALRYGIRTRVLRRLNNLYNDKILGGEILVVDPFVFVKTFHGETLSRIATKFKTSVAQLCALNNIANANMLPERILIKVPIH